MNRLKPSSRITSSRISNTTVIFLFAAPIVVIVYLSYIFNPAHIDNFFMYIIQLIADAISITVLLSLWLTILMDVIITQHHRAHEDNSESYAFEKEPTIDVFITVAGEPIEIVRETAIAAVNMHYPHNTFLLDDGHSSEIKKLAEELNATYTTRKDNLFAKSGNLNNGLKYSKSDFFAIFDADQVPALDFIEKLLPYMADPKLAMVQSPQSYRNIDKFIASGTAQAQEIFYKYVCPAKNISNSAFCVGTNMIFRRVAIDEIGGIAQIGHSEDVWTSLLLHEKGWKTLFVNEILAQGKAPETISSYFKQQLRWAKGGMSMLFLQNPLFSPTLSLDQKIQYFSSNFYYLVGFSMLAYLISPLAYLLFGIKAIQTESGLVWLIHYLPYFGLYYSLSWLLLGKIYISTLATALASFYPYILAFFSIVFGTKLQWTATTSRGSSKISIMKWIWPHVFFIILTVFSFIVGWYNPSANFWATLYNTGWAGVNMYLLIIFVLAEYRESQKIQA